MPDSITTTIAPECRHEEVDLAATGRRVGLGLIASVSVTCKQCGLKWLGQLGENKYAEMPAIAFFPMIQPPQVSNGKTVKAAQKVTVKKPDIPKKDPLDEGPGMELKLIFTGLGVPACQACDDLARDMNEKGLEWCEDNVDAIVESILPRATEWLQRPEGGWTDRFKALAPNFAKRHVIKGYVQLALNNWREKCRLKQMAE